MKPTRRTTSWRPRRRAAIVVLLALLLPIVVGISAFAINISYMHLVRAQVRIAADASARAGSRMLVLTQDASAAIQAAKDVALANRVAGRPLTLQDDQIQLGVSLRTAARWSFSPGGALPNSVRVFARRDATHPDGEVPLFLPSFLSRDQFSPVSEATAAQVDRDIALVVDRSGSMASSVDGSPAIPAGGGAVPLNSRWRALERAANDFLNALEATPTEEKVSLITFSTAGDTRLEVLLTSDLSQIRQAIQRYTDRWEGGRTAIGEGLQQGLDELMSVRRRPLSKPVVVILTDGIHNSGRSPMSIPLADEVLYTLTFSSAADRDLMSRLAERGHGRHWHADDEATLSEAFIEIGRSVPTLLID